MTPRWRAAADGVTLALGASLWVALVFVPGLYVGAYGRGGTLVLSMGALVPLAVGLALRSEVWLLLLYPAALILPLAADPRLSSETVYGLLGFLLVAASFLAYLLGVSFLVSFREAPPADRSRRLPSAEVPLPPRWKRRLRIYVWLTVLSAVFPATLLYAANFHAGNRAYLRELYPGRTGSLLVVLNLGVLAFWLATYATTFLGVLKLHRTGDRELLRDLSRHLSGRRAPSAVFYLAVFMALVFMGLLVLLRYR